MVWWHLEGMMGEEKMARGTSSRFSIPYCACIPTSGSPFHLFCRPRQPEVALIATSIIAALEVTFFCLQPSSVSFSCYLHLNPSYIYIFSGLPGCPQNARKIKMSHLGCIKIFCLTMFLSLLLDLYSHFTVHVGLLQH